MAGPMDNYTITLRTTPDKLASAVNKSFPAKASWTVSDIKKQIYLITNIYPRYQILIYNVTPLLDEWARLGSIVDQPPGANITIDLVDRWISPKITEVRVKMSDSTRHFRVGVELSTTTVGQFKDMIDEEIGVPRIRQILFARISGRAIDVPLFDDDLCSDVFFNGGELYLTKLPQSNTVQIRVEVTTGRRANKTFRMEVGVDTVNTLIAKIWRSELVPIRRHGQITTKFKSFSLHLGADQFQGEILRGDRILSSYAIGTTNGTNTIYLTPVEFI